MRFRDEIENILFVAYCYLMLNAMLATIAYKLAAKDIFNPSFNAESARYLWFPIGIGVFQLIYAMPMLYYLNRKGRSTTAKGIIVGAVITALLNGGCWIKFLSGLR